MRALLACPPGRSSTTGGEAGRWARREGRLCPLYEPNERLSLMRLWLLRAACLVVAIVLPFFIPAYYVQFISKALIMGILAMALNLVVGQGGLVSLCHAAFFGLAGYVLALCSPRYDAASLLLTLPLAVAAS